MANETKQKAPRRYEKMRDSGVEWIGMVPEHWQVRPVKAYYKIVTGFTPPSKQDDLYDDNGEIWVTISDMVTPIIKNSKQHITVDYALTHIKEKVPKGSLLYSFKLSVGNVAIAGTELYTNEAIASFIPSDTISIPFLKYSSSLIVGNAVQNIYGAAIMNQQRILNAPIVFPPLSEQNIIAEYLEKKCKDIDIVIAEAKASIEEYKAWKSSIIYEAVTKGLDSTAEMKDSGVEWIGKIPKHWGTTALKRICKRISDGSHYSPPTTAFGLPYVTAGDIHGKGINYTKCRTISKSDFDLLVKTNCQPHLGDVLLVKDGATTGRVGLMTDDGPCVLLSSVAMLTPNDGISSEYLMYLLESDVFQYQIKKTMAGSAMPRTTLSKLMVYTAILCPFDEQVKIVNYLNAKCSHIEDLISEKLSLISDLESYKKSLIYEVVTGKRNVLRKG